MVCVFTRSMTDELAGLVSQIDESLETWSEQKLAAFVVLMTDTPDDSVDELKSIAERDGLRGVPLTIFRRNGGPEDYHIADDYDVTVVMWSEGVVRSSHGFRQARLSRDDVDEVMAGVRSMVGE